MIRSSGNPSVATVWLDSYVSGGIAVPCRIEVYCASTLLITVCRCWDRVVGPKSYAT